jgi:endonuclease/exonuclease/phosphatase family metal-dependent hydrolase
LRIVSYNIHGCVGSRRRRDPGRIADVLEALAPDVVALQEVDSRASRGGLDQAMILARRLDMQLEEGPLLRDHQGHYGNAVMSRWPLRRTGEGMYATQGLEARGWLEVEITPLDGPAWRIVTTHLDLGGRVRSAQLYELAARLTHLAGPLVLAGDLNEWRPWSGAIRALSSAVNLLPPVASFPSWRPFLALDRLAVKGVVAAAGPRVDVSALTRRASDHLPLWADIAAA